MNKIIVYQAVADFFNDYPTWRANPLMRQWFPELILDSRQLKLEYDYLFKGTHADIYIPLWASACKAQGKILLDQTTLDLIKLYYLCGYQPVWVDGNPPDYIGEQFLFLSYLETIIQAGIEDQFERDFIKLRQELLTEYLYPTLKLVVKGIKAATKRNILLNLADLLESLWDKETEWPIVEGEARKLDSNLAQAPIPVNEAEIIATAGINNCGGICVIRPTVQEGCMLRIDTDHIDRQQPQLKACVRGRGYRKTFLSAERLRYPMKRVGERGAGTFERISWSEAVAIIASEWQRIKKEYGVSSRYLMYGYGITGIMLPYDFAKRLLSLDGGYLDYYNSYSSACTRYITPYIYGTADSGNSMADLLNTKYLILWGHNPVETHFGTEQNQYLHQLKQKGVKIIVIDPRFSDTAAAYADEWLSIRPSTDSALADGMAYVIWSEGLQDQQFMDRFCLGFDEAHMPAGIAAGESYHSYLFGLSDGIVKDSKWAEAITAIPAATIIKIAREYATAKPACLLPGLGFQRTGNGEQSIRSTAMLCCLTGNVGVAGGSSGSWGGVIEHNRLIMNHKIPNPFPGKIPVFQWSKAIEHGVKFNQRKDGLKGVDQLDSNIKMIMNLAGNTLINQHSDINNSIRILTDTSKCEFIIGSDIFMTASSRFADVLLPATSVFEGINMANPWIGSNYFLFHNQVIEPMFECRFEWDWLKEVAAQLGYDQEFIDGKPRVEDWLKETYASLRLTEPELPSYDEMKQRGGWQYQQLGYYIAFQDQINDPDHHPFPTPSGKIELFSNELFQMKQPDQIPAIPKYVACPEGPADELRAKFPLQLIGWHTKRRCHSIHDNNEWLDEVEQPAVWLHPDDAAARQIEPGELVEVFNRRGCIRIPVLITRRILKGVVAISQGGWYKPNHQGVDLRGSINVLTSVDHPTPLAKGNPQHTNLVEVRKV